VQKESQTPALPFPAALLFRSLATAHTHTLSGNSNVCNCLAIDTAEAPPLESKQEGVERERGEEIEEGEREAGGVSAPVFLFAGESGAAGRI